MNHVVQNLQNPMISGVYTRFRIHERLSRHKVPISNAMPGHMMAYQSLLLGLFCNSFLEVNALTKQMLADFSGWIHMMLSMSCTATALLHCHTGFLFSNNTSDGFECSTASNHELLSLSDYQSQYSPHFTSYSKIAVFRPPF